MQDLSSEIHKNINIKLPEKNKQLSFQEDECHEEEEDEEETNYYNFQNSIKSKQDSIDFTDRSKAK